MRSLIPKLLLLVLPLSIAAQTGTTSQTNVFTVDIDHFWIAYDSVRTTPDSTLQLQYIQRLYIDQGTPGLHAFIHAREYTAQRWRDKINAYPKFWASIRPNTLQVKNRVGELEGAVKKLHDLYPTMRESKMYFTIGCLNCVAAPACRDRGGLHFGLVMVNLLGMLGVLWACYTYLIVFPGIVCVAAAAVMFFSLFITGRGSRAPN